MIAATHERHLGREDVKRLLQSGPVQFVFADVEKPLRRIPANERLVFWKAEGRSHIVEEPNKPIDISTYPEGYAYAASECVAAEPTSPPIIVLERHH